MANANQRQSAADNSVVRLLAEVTEEVCSIGEQFQPYGPQRGELAVFAAGEYLYRLKRGKSGYDIHICSDGRLRMVIPGRALPQAPCGSVTTMWSAAIQFKSALETGLRDVIHSELAKREAECASALAL